METIGFVSGQSSTHKAPDIGSHAYIGTHAYITQLYIMSIQPVNKAAEHS